VTTVNRKRVRLIEKLQGLKSNLLTIHVTAPGSSNSESPLFDPNALYVSRKTLIELLETDWALGELTDG